MNSRMKLSVFILISFISTNLMYSQQVDTLINTDWSVSGSWSSNSVPSTGDTVVILSALGTITNINTNPSIVRILNGGSATLGASLTISDSLDIYSGGSLAVADQSLTVNGNIGGAGTLTASTGSINLESNWNISTFTSGTSNVSFIGSGDSEILISTTFNRLTVNKDDSLDQVFSGSAITATIDSAFIILGGIVYHGSSELTIAASSSGTDLFSMSSSNATLNITGTSSFPVNFESINLSSSSTVDYSGNNNTITHLESDAGVLTYGNLILSGGGGAFKSTAGALDVNGNFYSDAIVIFGTYAHVFSGNWTMTSGQMVVPTPSVIVFNGPLQTINEAVAGGFDTIRVTGGGLVDIAGPLSVSGLHISNNTTFDVSASNHTLNIIGNFVKGSGSTFNPRNGQVNINRAGNQTISGATFYNVTFSGSGVSHLKTLTGNLIVLQDITINNAKLRAGTFSIDVYDDWTMTNSARFEHYGTVRFNEISGGTDVKDIDVNVSINDTASAQFYNLQISQSTG
ncbi:MAG: hypothetical protein K8I82_18450, partial [Anaerolineae bacterium]|nr:hypothetical protein [Anaerolineae bacterium]